MTLVCHLSWLQPTGSPVWAYTWMATPCPCPCPSSLQLSQAGYRSRVAHSPASSRLSCACHRGMACRAVRQRSCLRQSLSCHPSPSRCVCCVRSLGIPLTNGHPFGAMCVSHLHASCVSRIAPIPFIRPSADTENCPQHSYLQSRQLGNALARSACMPLPPSAHRSSWGWWRFASSTTCAAALHSCSRLRAWPQVAQSCRAIAK